MRYFSLFLVFALSSLSLRGQETIYASFPLIAAPTAAAAPILSPAAGTYISTQIPTITSSTSGVTICYTINGDTPTAATPGTCDSDSGNESSLTNGATITVSSTETVKAIATIASGYSNSSVTTVPYILITIVGAVGKTITTSTSIQSTASVSVAAGEKVLVFCSSGTTTVTALTATDTYGNTFYPLTLLFEPSNLYVQASWADITTGHTGSADYFTCSPTPAASTNTMGILATVYAGLASGAPNTSVVGDVSGGYTNTFTSPTFSTTATSNGTYNILCVRINSAVTLTEGAIGTLTPTSFDNTNTRQACEAVAQAGNVSSITANMTSSSSTNWDGSVVAFNY